MTTNHWKTRRYLIVYPLVNSPLLNQANLVHRIIVVAVISTSPSIIPRSRVTELINSNCHRAILLCSQLAHNYVYRDKCVLVYYRCGYQIARKYFYGQFVVKATATFLLECFLNIALIIRYLILLNILNGV